MGSSRTQTVGYKYYFGLHMGIGRGPIDAFCEIRVGERQAWIGEVFSNQTIDIFAPNLFGGDEKEGGIEGPFDVMMGEPDQVPGSRIRAMLGAVIPGYRGVLTAFFNGHIGSNNPYPKPWKFRVRRILKGWDTPVFLPWAAGITWLPLAESPVVTIPFVDFPFTSGLTSVGTIGNADFNYVEYEPISGVPWEPNLNEGIYLQSINAGDTQSFNLACDEPTKLLLQQLRRIRTEFTVQDITQSPGTLAPEIATWEIAREFSTSASAVGLWFIRISWGYITTGGGGTGYFGFTATGTGFGFDQPNFSIVLGETANFTFVDEIDLDLHTYRMYFNGVLVYDVPFTVTALFLVQQLYEAATQTVNLPSFRVRDVRIGYPYQQGRMGMNGAHIIYEALTNAVWGRGLPPSAIDEPSFISAATQLLNENFALCIKWTRQDSIENFVQIILNHIGGVLYQHRRTGLLVLKLIRDDYSTDFFGPGAVPGFDNESGLLEIREATVGTAGRSVNTITVKWHDQVEDEDRTVTVRNNAAIQMAGGVINAIQKEYTGLPTAELAARVAQRDLRAASTSLRKFSFVLRWDVMGDATTIHPGDVIRIRDDARMIPWTFVRVGRVEYGSVTDGTIVVDAVQDVFSLPARSFSVNVPSALEPPVTTPCIAEQRVIEVPYFMTVRRLSAADLDYTPDDVGYLGVLNSRGRPTNAGVQIAVRPAASTPDDIPPDGSYLCE